MNALMLLLALRFGSWRIELKRVLLGALAGAAIALAAARQPAWNRSLLWLPAAVVMMRIAQGRAAKRYLLAGAMLLICAAGLVGGIILALWGATGSLLAAYLLSGAVCIGICAAHTRRTVQEPMHVRMLCSYRGKNAVFEAMIDSGNTLRDYLTHLPVIVLPEKTGRHALNLADFPLRPIFAQTAGGRPLH